MAATVVAPNNNQNGPSPRSSASSSPQSQTSRLPQHGNTPLYTQEEVVRFVQAALAAAYREHHVNARQPSTQSLIEERIMKPRVHMYETLGAKRTMIATLELPGLQKEDVHITARPNGELVISGERKPQHLLYLQNIRSENDSDQAMDEDAEEKEDGRTVFNELKFGKFQRSIRLPAGTDVSLPSHHLISQFPVVPVH